MLNLIPIGKENAIKRSELCALSGLPDRRMRMEIEALQMQGYPIVAQLDGSGYYIPRTPEGRIFYVKILRKYAKELNYKADAILFTDYYDNIGGTIAKYFAVTTEY